jgi:hypothetical protein
MIVKAITNKATDLPLPMQEMGFPTAQDDTILDITPGANYAVYAMRVDNEQTEYFVHTGTENVDSFWWMPSQLYEVVDSTKPEGWQIKTDSNTVLRAYPSLFDWQIEEGIIDGDDAAVDVYQNEVEQDKSFPTKQAIAELNEPLSRSAAEQKHQENVRLAKERGYEMPEKQEE